MPDPVPNPDLTTLATALAALRPLPDRLNRDPVMFEAGRQSVSRRSWAWATATGVLSAACLVLSGVLLFRSPPDPVIRIVYVPEAPPVAASNRPPALASTTAFVGVPAAEEATADWPVNSVRLRDQVLRFGVDAFPEITFPLAAPGQRTFSDWPADSTASPLFLRPLLRTPGDRS
jgi:hypothetical protein